VALVALFFALGRGAMAANTYIRSADPIPSGDLAGSTYGSPLIASGKVTNGKLANCSLTARAPDSAKLGGNAPSDYGAVMSGRVNGLTTIGVGDFWGAKRDVNGDGGPQRGRHVAAQPRPCRPRPEL
jgi:hypothetical protein